MTKLFWTLHLRSEWGERESYPKKSAAILKNYLPQMEEKVLEGMGHGQYLHEHPSEYANALLRFFSERM